MPQPRDPLDALKDLTALAQEHMTDEELLVSKLRTDQMLHGFSVIDAEGNRVDPTTLKPYYGD